MKRNGASLACRVHLQTNDFDQRGLLRITVGKCSIMKSSAGAAQRAAIGCSDWLGVFVVMLSMSYLIASILLFIFLKIF